MGIPLDLGPVDLPPKQDTTTPPPLVIPTPSLSEGSPTMRMIPTPELRVQSSDTLGTSRHTHTSAPIDNLLPEGEEDDIIAKEVAATQGSRVYLPVGTKVRKSTLKFGMSLSSVRLRSTRFNFGGTIGGAFSDSKGVTSSRFMSLGSREPPSGSGSYFTRYERRGRRMDALEMGRTPTFGEVLERTQNRKKDCLWVDKCSHDCKLFHEAFEAEKNRLEAEWQAIIDARGPEPLSIDEEAIWTWIASSRKKGRIYDKGVVPAYFVPLIIGDVNGDDTATGHPDVRKEAEAHRQRVAQVEAVCDEKVRTLETTLESQSQEVSQLKKAYSDMYNFLEQMRSGGSGSAAFTAMPSPPPPPPPLARSPRPPPQPDRPTNPSQHDDDPDYV
ncbi:hypothetical protein PIB30_071629 [Stylosanthes scabra]|uniref:Uncharacterized protein n=1 Tax=Stylosanthes scabra TaxID=79078 RepID=A0ABU6SNY9_9FABA|nr:hypothetical protein [Stylosanthes scabra]